MLDTVLILSMLTLSAFAEEPEAESTVPDILEVGENTRTQLAPGVTLQCTVVEGGTKPPPAEPPPKATPEPEPADVAVTEEAGPVPVGRVVSRTPETAVIDLGSDDGLALGDRVEVFEEREIELSGETGIEEVRVLIAEVTAVAPGRSELLLGRNEFAPVGSAARPSEEGITRNVAIPPRIGQTWTVGGMTRGLLSLDEDGGAVLAEGFVRWRAEAPIMVEFRARPAYVGIGSTLVGGGSGSAIVAYDGQFFAMGLGGGLSAGSNIRPGPVAIQYARFGAVDGLLVDSTLAFRRDRDWTTNWALDMLDIIGQIPVAPRSKGTWILLRGAGGDHLAFGEGGVRTRIRGNGRNGTFTLTAVVGGAGVWSRQPRPNGDFRYINYIGPTVGAGVEWTGGRKWAQDGGAM